MKRTHLQVTWRVGVEVCKVLSVRPCVPISRADVEPGLLTTGHSRWAGTRWSARSRHAPPRPPTEPWRARRIPESEQEREGLDAGAAPSQWDRSSLCHQPWVCLFPISGRTQEWAFIKTFSVLNVFRNRIQPSSHCELLFLGSFQPIVFGVGGGARVDYWIRLLTQRLI